MSYQLNRRSFILASGITALASTRVLGANDTLRVGVIGAGGRMGDLLNAADHFGHYQIVAVSDVYGPRRDAVKLRSNGIATTHVDYRAVLEQPIDAVIIASPDHWHVRMAVDALAAGKDVYLEKPVTHAICRCSPINTSSSNGIVPTPFRQLSAIPASMSSTRA